MGKKLIIKGADFSENGIPTVGTELIYDSITGFSASGNWTSDNASAVSIPPAAQISGRKITSIVIKKYTADALQDIGIAKYNRTSGTFTLLATIPMATFNANELTSVNLGGVMFGSNDLLMVGATSATSGTAGAKFAITAGNESSQLGRYTLMKTGVLNDVTYTTAIMCKIYAEVE